MPEIKENFYAAADTAMHPGPELTEEERAEFDRAWETMMSKRSAMEDESIKAHCDAQQQLLAYGDRALPHLSRKSPKDLMERFQMHTFTNALAGEKDLNLVLEMLESAFAQNQAMQGATYPLEKALSRIAYEVRQRDPNDPRLAEMAGRLIAVLDRYPVERNANYELLQALSITGCKAASERISALIHSGDSVAAGTAKDLTDQLADIGAVKTYGFQPPRFDTWEEILKAREASAAADNSPDGYGAPDFGLSVDGMPEFERPYRKPGTDSRFPVEDDYGTMDDACARADVLVRARGRVPATLHEAYKLHFFNLLTRDPDVDDARIESEFQKLERYSALEESMSDPKNPLPTIGTEIEIPYGSMAANSREAIANLGIRHYPENNDLHEMVAHYSYSAQAQARVLQELARLGAIPTDPRTGRVKPDELLSLHVNLGLPEGIGDDKKYKTETQLLTDVTAYAFASPYRILHRKTDESVKVKTDDVDDSTKTDSGGGTRSAGGEKPTRLELRPMEFRDYPTFRMLVETQRLGAMCISELKLISGQSLSRVEKRLSDLWMDFYWDAANYLFTEADMEPGLIDKDREKAAMLMVTTDIKPASRRLISKYARLAGRIIAEELPEMKG